MKHLDFIRNLPCAICGDDTTVEAAHVSFPDPRFAKTEKGTGRKQDDCWTVPLCGRHHRQQHGMNERDFWELRWRVDANVVALALFAVSVVSGDLQTGEKILAHWRPPHDSSSLGFSSQTPTAPG